MTSHRQPQNQMFEMMRWICWDKLELLSCLCPLQQLDSEVDYVLQSQATLRGVQVQVGEKEEGLSELLQFQQTVRKKIHQSKSILTLSRSFHLTANQVRGRAAVRIKVCKIIKQQLQQQLVPTLCTSTDSVTFLIPIMCLFWVQLEVLLQSEPSRISAGSAGSCGSKKDELSWYQDTRQQIQNLLRTTWRQKTDICTAITQSVGINTHTCVYTRTSGPVCSCLTCSPVPLLPAVPGFCRFSGRAAGGPSHFSGLSL